LFIGAMYFLLIAPQRKRQKEHEAMVKAVKAGDKIVSAGGIYGQITKVKDDRVTLRISENVTIDLAKSSIGSKVTSENAESGETN
ncbi:MAG: preprotein translocase subunit YajC, partial [Opitutales bacterium]